MRFWSFAERLTLPRHTLSRVVGTASSTAFEPYANIHDSTLTDSLVTVFYPGLSFHYYRGREHEFLFSIMVTAPRDDLPLPIGIGSPDSLVLATFGRPSHQWPADDSTVLAFDVPQAEDGLISQLQFTVIHRTVSKITWFFPVD